MKRASLIPAVSLGNLTISVHITAVKLSTIVRVVTYSPIRYVRNRLCTCCPIQATTSKLLITEAKYCEEQRSRYSQHRPVQLTEACTDHHRWLEGDILSATQITPFYSTEEICSISTLLYCKRALLKATAAKDIFIWSIITRYGCSICHTAVDSVALKHSLTLFPGTLPQIATVLPFSLVLLITYGAGIKSEISNVHE